MKMETIELWEKKIDDGKVLYSFLYRVVPEQDDREEFFRLNIYNVRTGLICRTDWWEYSECVEFRDSVMSGTKILDDDEWE